MGKSSAGIYIYMRLSFKFQTTKPNGPNSQGLLGGCSGCWPDKMENGGISIINLENVCQTKPLHGGIFMYVCKLFGLQTAKSNSSNFQGLLVGFRKDFWPKTNGSNPHPIPGVLQGRRGRGIVGKGHFPGPIFWLLNRTFGHDNFPCGILFHPASDLTQKILGHLQIKCIFDKPPHL